MDKYNSKITIDDILNASKKEVETWHKEYGNSSIVTMLKALNFNRRFVKAEGIRVWDDSGAEYLDFLGGYSSLAVGHNHPRIIRAFEKVLHDEPKLIQAVLSPFDGALKAKLAAITPGDLSTSFLCNSGAEAIEGAVKLARASTGRKKLVATLKGFHGKTMGALSVTGKQSYQSPFNPILPSCEFVPFNDIKALEKALLKEDVAAFFVEPIQGEAGIILPDDDYLKAAHELCKRYGTLLVVDEIQTGLGRTGKMFASDWYGVAPDIITLAKSLSGGMVPVGAFVTTRKIWNKAYGGMKKALLHTSTFGGNTLACVAAIETINIIEDENLVERSEVRGQYLMIKLQTLAESYGIIESVRGRGLLAGIEFKKPTSRLIKKKTEEMSATIASLIAGDLLNSHNIITAFTFNNPNTIRLAPPLLVSEQDIDKLVDSLAKSFEKNRNFTRALLTTVRNLIN